MACLWLCRGMCRVSPSPGSLPEPSPLQFHRSLPAIPVSPRAGPVPVRRVNAQPIRPPRGRRQATLRGDILRSCQGHRQVTRRLPGAPPCLCKARGMPPHCTFIVGADGSRPPAGSFLPGEFNTDAERYAPSYNDIKQLLAKIKKTCVCSKRTPSWYSRLDGVARD